MAKEILHKHDQACSGRAVPVSAQTLDHHKMSIAWLSVGKKWRVLRKITKEQMFSISRLDSSQGLRQEKLRKLLDYVHECCLSRRVVDIGEAVYVTRLISCQRRCFQLILQDLIRVLLRSSRKLLLAWRRAQQLLILRTMCRG
ncbi:UNVERIFIED_CONTAM: cytochrome [Sesamum latifolium]|uniref:Cytochrome n=1 Tax=Sesamum latifolium TaxID=2727402 RepID=A0AAW2WAX2_9LAMI